MSTSFITFPKDKNDFIEEYFLFRQFTTDNIELVKKQGFFEDVSTDDLNQTIKDIYAEFNKYLEKVPSINEYFYSDAVKYCIEKFVDSEMDYITSGIRGMGRISTFIPRFGGFYSEILKGLSNDDLSIIKGTIFKIIKLGYETAVFMEVALEKEPIKLNYFDTLPFFNIWIPKIYGADWTSDSTASSFITQSAWDSMIYFCFKIADATNFPKKSLVLRNVHHSKLALIIGKYVEAGFILRFLETRVIK